MEGQMTFEFAKRPTIKGYPELRWTGKRPYESTQYYPAQLRERYGEETNGWINKIFWGDNLQVMSHLLKEYRGKVQLIYIDPPFDSRVDYKMKVELKGKKATNDISTFEEKQYGDIWTNDEYLQFMYERIVIMKELLSDKEIYFTGMFTSNQGDLSVQYYDPESKRLRKYYPDFLALMEDGSYQLIEVKGDNKIDDEVVLAKKAAAEEMAVASGVHYLMYAGSTLMKSNVLEPTLAVQQTSIDI